MTADGGVCLTPTFRSMQHNLLLINKQADTKEQAGTVRASYKSRKTLIERHTMMADEDATLWQEEQLALLRKVQEETRSFVAKQRALIAETQKKARFWQHAFDLGPMPDYYLLVIVGAYLSVVAAAVAVYAIGIILYPAIAAHCADVTSAWRLGCSLVTVMRSFE